MDLFLVVPAAGLALFFGIALTIVLWQSRRSDRIIRNWAKKYGYEVLEKRQPLVNLGPFRWEKPQGRTFYRLTVRDAKGQVRQGWVCCGVQWLGLLRNRVEMRWDIAEPPETNPAGEGIWPLPPTR